MDKPGCNSNVCFVHLTRLPNEKCNFEKLLKKEGCKFSKSVFLEMGKMRKSEHQQQQPETSRFFNQNKRVTPRKRFRCHNDAIVKRQKVRQAKFHFENLNDYCVFDILKRLNQSSLLALETAKMTPHLTSLSHDERLKKLTGISITIGSNTTLHSSTKWFKKYKLCNNGNHFISKSTYHLECLEDFKSLAQQFEIIVAIELHVGSDNDLDIYDCLDTFQNVEHLEIFGNVDFETVEEILESKSKTLKHFSFISFDKKREEVLTLPPMPVLETIQTSGKILVDIVSDHTIIRDYRSKIVRFHMVGLWDDAFHCEEIKRLRAAFLLPETSDDEMLWFFETAINLERLIIIDRYFEPKVELIKDWENLEQLVLDAVTIDDPSRLITNGHSLKSLSLTNSTIINLFPLAKETKRNLKHLKIESAKALQLRKFFIVLPEWKNCLEKFQLKCEMFHFNRLDVLEILSKFPKLTNVTIKLTGVKREWIADLTEQFQNFNIIKDGTFLDIILNLEKSKLAEPAAAVERQENFENVICLEYGSIEIKC